MLDFSKLTAAVKSVADLAASHATLSAVAVDAAAIEAKAKAVYDAAVADLTSKAQSELDSIVGALEAALASNVPLTHAGAAGITAVAGALAPELSGADALAKAAAPVSPTPPAVSAAPAPDAPVVAGPAAPLAVGLVVPAAPAAVPAAATAAPLAQALGLMDIPAPKTVEEYNAMRAQGLLP